MAWNESRLGPIHANRGEDEMPQDGNHLSSESLTRRSFLKRAGVAGTAVLGGTLWPTAPAAARARRGLAADTPLRHVIISCQENRSFDHYFGYAPWIGSYGPPPGWTQPDGQGGSVDKLVNRYGATLVDAGCPPLVGRHSRAVEQRRHGRLCDHELQRGR